MNCFKHTSGKITRERKLLGQGNAKTRQDRENPELLHIISCRSQDKNSRLQAVVLLVFTQLPKFFVAHMRFTSLCVDVELYVHKQLDVARPSDLRHFVPRPGHRVHMCSKEQDSEKAPKETYNPHTCFVNCDLRKSLTMGRICVDCFGCAHVLPLCEVLTEVALRHRMLHTLSNANSTFLYGVFEDRCSCLQLYCLFRACTSYWK